MEHVDICKICLDRFDQIKRLIKTLPCGHTYCRKCIATYARDKAKEYGTNFLCPDCNEPFEPKGLVGKQWLTQWEKRKKALGKVVCPQPGCPGEILGRTCLRCRHLICTFCLEELHDGPCKEGIVKNIIYKINKTKQCPKCGVNIEKNGGCNHMTCQSCGHEFNWDDVKKDDTIRHIQIPQRARLDELEEPKRCQKCARYCQTVDPLCCSCFRREGNDVEYEPCQCCRF